MDKVSEWQLEHPQGTKDMCISWLKQEQYDGRLQVDDGTTEPANKRARKK
jgi:tRNA nucleotidyltransferase (CCA-adding enzyme)